MRAATCPRGLGSSFALSTLRSQSKKRVSFSSCHHTPRQAQSPTQRILQALEYLYNTACPLHSHIIKRQPPHTRVRSSCLSPLHQGSIVPSPPCNSYSSHQLSCSPWSPRTTPMSRSPPHSTPRGGTTPPSAARTGRSAYIQSAAATTRTSRRTSTRRTREQRRGQRERRSERERALLAEGGDGCRGASWPAMCV